MVRHEPHQSCGNARDSNGCNGATGYLWRDVVRSAHHILHGLEYWRRLPEMECEIDEGIGVVWVGNRITHDRCGSLHSPHPTWIRWIGMLAMAMVIGEVTTDGNELWDL